MDPLYKIIKQLSDEEFQDIYQNLTSNKAEKSASFLKTIRESDNPVEDFLEKTDISASAFYVLKSRLNQRVESFLLNRLGDPKLETIHKVFKVYELIFSNPREIAVTTLKKLEKTMLAQDNPSVLMVVYRGLKMLHSYDEESRIDYDKQYNQTVAFYLTTEKAQENVMTFFRVYDKYYLGRREKDYNELIKLIEKIHNINNLYQSQRLYICKAIVHLFAMHFVDLPDRVLDIMDPPDEAFEKAFEILENNPEDILFKNLNLIFDYLRYVNHRKENTEKENMYYELLDYKIQELLTGFNFGMDCSQILFFKLEKHRADGNLDKLRDDVNDHLDEFSVDTYRLVNYLNYHMMLAYEAFHSKRYEEGSRLLYRVRNEVNLRKHPHMDVETKVFLALFYVIQKETDLATQLILSLQRQLKKPNFSTYVHGKMLLKVLNNRLGSRTAKKNLQLQKYVDEFNRLNVGRNALLPHLDLKSEHFLDQIS